VIIAYQICSLFQMQYLELVVNSFALKTWFEFAWKALVWSDVALRDESDKDKLD